MSENARYLLKKAVEILGRTAVAAGLNASRQQLDAWLEGEFPVSDARVLSLIDLIDRPLAPPRVSLRT